MDFALDGDIMVSLILAKTSLRYHLAVNHNPPLLRMLISLLNKPAPNLKYEIRTISNKLKGTCLQLPLLNYSKKCI